MLVPNSYRDKLFVYLAGSFVVSPNRLNTLRPTLVRQRNLTLSLNPLYPLLPSTINLYTLNGQRIKSYNSMGIANIAITLPQALPKGTYYIQVTTGKLHQTKKIVII